MNQKPRKIVVIGGGTGTYTVLSALKKYDVNLSAVVSMCDDGGSTGRLRDEYGVLPPGDIRRSLIALSSDDTYLRKLFEFRFAGGKFAGHNFGNLFLTALEKVSGNFHAAVKTAARILDVKGNVYPVTLDDIRLFAELESGEIISGETNIDIPKHNPNLKIKKIFIKPMAKSNPDAVKAILNADLIVIGPGDLYTSVLPNFLVSGISEAVLKSNARKVYICNLMTKNGETNNFSVRDFVEEIQEYGKGLKLNYVFVNTKAPSSQRLLKYAKQKAELVSLSKNFRHPGLLTGNLITQGGLVRHDMKRLGAAIMKIC